MDQPTITDTGLESDQSTFTRRVFAGGLLATLAATGLVIPAAAQGLKDVDEDDDQNDRDDEEESGGIPESWEEIGITSEFTYESPQYGYSVEWEAPWIVDPMYPGMTDSEMGLDDLTLKWDAAPRQSISVTLLGLQASRMGIEGFGDYMLSPDGIGMWESGTTEVEERFYDADETSFELLLAMTDTDNESLNQWVLMVVVDVGSDAWMMATLTVGDDFIEDTYKDFSELVVVDGESLIRLSTWRDIERAIR